MLGLFRKVLQRRSPPIQYTVVVPNLWAPGCRERGYGPDPGHLFHMYLSELSFFDLSILQSLSQGTAMTTDPLPALTEIIFIIVLLTGATWHTFCIVVTRINYNKGKTGFCV